MQAEPIELRPNELLKEVFGEVSSNDIPSLSGETVLDAEFVNYTPYMGGGAYGTTFHCLDPYCKDYTFAAPTGETVKGRMRWLARIAVGTGKGYKLDEEVIRKLFGYVSKGDARASAIQVKVTVTPTAGGKPHADYGTIRDILARAFELSPEGLRKPNKVVDLLEQAGYAILATEHGWVDELDDFVRRVEPILDAAEAASDAIEFLKLFMIPRFKLLALKISTEVKSLREIGLPKDKIIDNVSRLLFELQPARPNTVEIKLEVKVIDSLVEPLLDSMRGDVARFACLLGLATPILGLGKASARGFGLFWPVKINHASVCGKDFPPLKDDTDNINYSEELIKLLRNVAEVADHLKEHTLDRIGKKWSNILLEEKRKAYTPILSRALSNSSGYKYIVVDKVVHPCPVNMSLYTKVPIKTETAHKLCCEAKAYVDKDIYFLLSAVGVACLKNVWKMRIKGKIVKSRGNCLDTWILGLPRSQKNTGYMLINGSVLKNKNVCKYLGVTCDKGEYGNYRCKGIKALGGLESGRRLSNVFAWLSPDYRVVLLPLAAAPDVPLGLREGKVLVHIGKAHQKTYVTEIVTANFDIFKSKLDSVIEYLHRLLTGEDLHCPKQSKHGHGGKGGYIQHEHGFPGQRGRGHHSRSGRGRR